MADEILGEFLEETAENLQRLDVEIVELEKDPANTEILTSVFRAIHTIKGTCGFLGLVRLERIAHAAESVLDRLRRGRIEPCAEAFSAVLAAIDTIKEIVGELERNGREPEADDGRLLAKLTALLEGDADTGTGASGAGAGSAEAVAQGPGEDEAAEPREVAHSGGTGEPAAGGGADEVGGGASRIEGGPSPGLRTAENTLRVKVEIVDRLMNLVSELVLTRNRLNQICRELEDEESPFVAPIQQLNRVTSDLQENLTRTRMQPIKNAWTKLPRIVRDVSQGLGKKVRIEMRGANTELDRQVIQEIADPLVHMVRNSLDHGIEPPEVRAAAGKDETGVIALNAYHEGGHIVIEVEDDGAGIDVERLRRKIVELGLISADRAAALEDREVVRYIFHPGLSTAERVTQVSGRGVGMDVVKSNLERIRGTIDVESTRGEGTRFRIKIPLTLAIISALIVSCGGRPFAIPQTAIVELVRIPAGDDRRVETMQGAEVFRLRGEILPLLHLGEVLGTERGEDDDEMLVAVMQVGSFLFGLVVGEVHDTEEIVVKSAGRLIQDIPVYAGTTVLGDGRVVPILDAGGLRAVLDGGDGGGERRSTEDSEETHEGTARTYLVFRGDPQRAPKAVHLGLVNRLEEFDASAIERAGDRWVVQYRGALIPLLPLDPTCDPDGGDGKVPAIVFGPDDARFGLLVGEIVDIVDAKPQIDLSAGSEGILGITVIEGRATEILDVAELRRRAGAASDEGREAPCLAVGAVSEGTQKVEVGS